MSDQTYTTEPGTAEGRCLGGDVSYHVEWEAFGIIHCHCQRCRKHTGAAAIGFIIFDRERSRFEWRSGRELLKSYKHDLSTRSFCTRCGSAMPGAASDGQKFGGIFAGNSLGLPNVTNHFYLFTASKAPWTVIPADVTQWETAIEPPDVPELNRPIEEGWITGSCLCGKVAFSARNPGLMMQCHCTRCQLSRAAAHATNLFVRSGDFRWRSGEDLVEGYKLPEAARFSTAFCRDCGSLLPRLFGESVNIPAGCLDSDPGMKPAGHIFTGTKAAWHTIHDDLPQWEDRPPAR